MNNSEKVKLKKLYEVMNDDELIQLALCKPEDYQEGVHDLILEICKNKGLEKKLNQEKTQKVNKQNVATFQRKQESQQTQSDKPLFLYISPARLILLSIASMSLYEAYWIYKNWRYIKERDGLDIKPFWRGIFGIFHCHSLLRRIHEDNDARIIQEPTFSAGGLATGWVILLIFANIVSRAPSIAASIIAAFIPSFMCLVPVQNYINSVTEKRNPNQKLYGWSSGHIVCLVFGLIIWALLLIGLGAEM